MKKHLLYKKTKVKNFLLKKFDYIRNVEKLFLVVQNVDLRPLEKIKKITILLPLMVCSVILSLPVFLAKFLIKKG